MSVSDTFHEQVLRTNRLLLTRVDELGDLLKKEREDRRREMMLWCDNFKSVVAEAQRAVQQAQQGGRNGGRDEYVRKEVEEALKKAGDFLLFETEGGRKEGD